MFNFNITDPKVVRNILIFGSIILSFYLIAFFVEDSSFSKVFTREYITPILLLSSTIFSLSVFSGGLSEIWKKRIRSLNGLLAILLVVMVIFSYLEIADGNAFVSSDAELTVVPKNIVDQPKKTDSEVAKILRAHAKKEYADVIGTEGFILSTSAQFTQEDNNLLNTFVAQDTQALFRDISLWSPLPILLVKQDFSMNADAFGYATGIAIKKPYSDNKSKIKKFFGKIWLGMKEAWWSIEGIFKKREIKEIDNNLLAESLLRKSAISYQISMLKKFKSEKNLDISDSDLILCDYILNLNDSLNHYVGGISYFDQKLSTLSLGANFLHQVIWENKVFKKKRDNRQYYHKLDSLRNMFLSDLEANNSNDAQHPEPTKNGAIDIDSLNNVQAPIAVNMPKTAKGKDYNQVGSKKNKTSLKRQPKKQPKNKSNPKGLNKKNHKPTGSKIIHSEEYLVNVEKERKGSDTSGNDDNYNEISANKKNDSKEKNRKGDDSDFDLGKGKKDDLNFERMLDKIKIKDPKERPRFKEHLEAILKKKWIRPSTNEYIIFEGDTKGTAKVFLNEVLGYTDPVNFEYELTNSSVNTPSIVLTQLESDFYEDQLLPWELHLSIIEYPRGAKIIIKEYNGDKKRAELFPFKTPPVNTE